MTRLRCRVRIGQYHTVLVRVGLLPLHLDSLHVWLMSRPALEPRSLSALLLQSLVAIQPLVFPRHPMCSSRNGGLSGWDSVGVLSTEELVGRSRLNGAQKQTHEQAITNGRDLCTRESIIAPGRSNVHNEPCGQTTTSSGPSQLPTGKESC